MYFLKVRAIALATWRETMRDRMLGALFILMMVLLGLVLALEGPEAVQASVVLDWSCSLMGAAALLVAIFWASSLLQRERDKRTLYVALSKPVTRFQFLLGKYLGLMGTLSLMVLGMSAALSALMAFLNAFDGRVLALMASLWVELGLLTALAFCFSSVTSGMLSALYAGGLFLLGQQAMMIREFAQSEVKLNKANYMIGQALYYLLPNFGAFDFKNTLLYGHQFPWSPWGWGLAYGAVASLGFLMVAAIAWEEREL